MSLCFRMIESKLKVMFSAMRTFFLLWSSSSLFFLESNAVIVQDTYAQGRFVGNESVDSLAYGGPYSAVFQQGLTLMECGSLCTKLPNGCESFNFVTPSNMDAKGRCELINGTTWRPSKFEARPMEFSKFYVSLSLGRSASFFKLIPAVWLGTEDVNVSPWATDCMAQAGGLTGFMVAQRNNRLTSMYTTDFKCRIFRHSLVMSNDPPVKINWNTHSNYSMRCPAGYVVTAVFDVEGEFPHANAVRCNKPALPWRVDVAGCRTIPILRVSALDPVSPMNDPGLTGTADSTWGAQCGNKSSIEAMVGISITFWLYNEYVFCCPLNT